MNAMKRFCVMVAVLTVCGGARMAHAAPPTVTPSPGYDARLQEQRATSATIYQPGVPASHPAPRRHIKHRH
jgi:hypothetical protein